MVIRDTIEQPAESEMALPGWMVLSSRGTDWGIVIVLALALLVVWPLVIDATLPATTALESAVQQVADYTSSLRQGQILPAWAPHAVAGYGAPIHLYSVNAGTVLASFLTLFVTGDPILSVRVVLIGAMLALPVGTYLLGQRIMGPYQGLLAASLVIFSPYFGLTLPILVGDLSGVVGFAAFPLLILVSNRTINHPTRADVLMLVLLTAVLWLSVPPLAIAAIVCSGLLALIGLPRPIKRRWRTIILATGAGALIPGVYLIPAAYYSATEIWHANPIAPHELQASVHQMLQPAIPVDPAALLTLPALSPGLPLLILAGFALLALLLRSMPGRATKVALLSGPSGIMCLMLSVSVASPWHLIFGLGVFSLAVFAGNGITLFAGRSQRYGNLLSLATILLVIWGSYSVWAPRDNPIPVRVLDGLGQVRFEQSGFGIPMLAPGAAIPGTLAPDVESSRFLISELQAGAGSRISPAQDGGTIAANLVQAQNHTQQYQISTRRVSQVRVLMAYHPGWRASLDGVPLVTWNDDGFLGIRLAGAREGMLTISWGYNTQVYLLAAGVSVIGVLISGLLLGRIPVSTKEDPDVIPVLLRPDQFRPLLIVVGLLSALVVLTQLSGGATGFQLQPGHRLEGQVPFRHLTDVGLEFLAFSPLQPTASVGSSLVVELAWQARVPLLEDYRVRVSLQNTETGQRIYSNTLVAPGYFHTARWRPGYYVQSPWRVDLGPEVSPGRYVVVVEALPCTESCDVSNRLSFFNLDGESAGQTLTLPAIITVQG
jgi:hypothetical protein